MKISALIAKLQDVLDEHGDLHVEVRDRYEDFNPVEECVLTPAEWADEGNVLILEA